MNWKPLLKDRVAQIFAAGFVALHLPFFFSILSPEALAAYAESQIELFTLPLAAFACLAGVKRLRGERERLLWQGIAAALGVWWFLRTVEFLTPGKWAGVGTALFGDILYVLFYMVVLYVVGTRPHIEDVDERAESIWRQELVGLLVFVLALLTYLVLVPSVVTPGRYQTWLPSMSLYIILDLFLAGWFALLVVRSKTARWRTIYTLLGVTAGLWAFTDGLEALIHAGKLDWKNGALTDLLWALPPIALVLAARVRHLSFEGRRTESAPTDARQVGAGWFGSRLLMYVFMFPFLHYGLHVSGVLAPDLRDVREVVMVGSLMALGALAVFERRKFQRYSDRLRTERGMAESRMRDHAVRLSALIYNAPLAILVLDRDLKIQLANPAFTEMFHYENHEAVGRSLVQLITRGEASVHATDVAKRVLAGETIHTTATRYRKDGTPIEVEFHAVPLLVAGVLSGVFILYEDISERLSKEEKVRETQKMEAMGRLAGGVAHDFNNLLMVIRGNNEMLPGLIDQPKRFRAHIGEIESAADRAAALTQQLLTFSRNRVVETGSIDLNALITEAERGWREGVAKNIGVSIDLAPDLGPIQANAGQIAQVVTNLVANACEAMPKGGTLKLETSNLALDEKAAAKLGDVLPGAYVVVRVIDSGSGIDKKIIDRIFDPFFTTKTGVDGAGLGLATVYGTVRQVGGFTRVKSKPGEGSAFTVHIPMAGGRSEPEKARARRAATKVKGETILVVEDELSVRRLTVDYLESKGYHVLDALESQEALRIVREHKGPIHLLLSDVVLPGMNGTELAEKVVGLRPETQVMLMSGYTDGSVLDGWRLTRGADFLQKPFTLEVLGQRLRSLIDRYK